MKLGRTVVLILPAPEKCFYATGRDYSGTGKNRTMTRLVNELNIFSVIPIKGFETERASGERIEFRGNEPFKTYWDKMKDFHYYSAYLTSSIGKSFLFVRGTTRVVGSWIGTEKGVFLLLPSIGSEETFNTRKEYNNFCNLFISALTELTNELRKTAGDYSLPAWTNAYLLPNEIERKRAIITKEKELQELLSERNQLKEEIAKIEKYKLLLCGSGRALEIQVANVFKEIGFDVEIGPEGRDDLILKYGEKIAVAEIKGVSKSASENHAAQLEKWVAEFMTSHNIKPKGILIVNAYCSIPLNERKDPPFPDQMISYSMNREHCLITTTQLLGIYLTVLSKPENTDQLINELFETKGVCQKFLDYEEYLIEDNTCISQVEIKLNHTTSEG